MKTEQPLRTLQLHTKNKGQNPQNELKRDPKPKTGRNREKTEAHYTTTKQARTERKQRLIKLKH